jgi:hypothetical protein
MLIHIMLPLSFTAKSAKVYKRDKMVLCVLVQKREQGNVERKAIRIQYP